MATHTLTANITEFEDEVFFRCEDLDFLSEKSFLHITNDDGSDSLIIDQDFDRFRTMHQCCNLAKDLLEKRCEVIFNVHQVSVSQFRIELNRAGSRLLHQIRFLHRIDSLSFKIPNPYLRLFLKHFHLVEGVAVKHRTAMYDIEEKTVFLEIIKALDYFLSEGCSKAFKEQVKNHQKTYRDNRKSLKDYVDALFEANARLLVIRLDLGYSKSETYRQKTLLFSPGKKGFSVSDVIEHRVNFMKMVDRKFGQYLKGYIWKLEHGQEKGFHYHVALFIDANKLRSDVQIARSLGECWKKHITGGEGLYFNCNANTQSYHSRAVGMIYADDESAQEGMARIVDYLTKMDLYIRVFLPDGARTLGKSWMPKMTGLGRPRSSKLSVTTQPVTMESIGSDSAPAGLVQAE